MSGTSENPYASPQTETKKQLDGAGLENAMPSSIGGHPPGLYTLFFTEMWERFSYYGMRALLVLFMTDKVRGGMELDAKTAAAIYGLYTAIVYMVSLPGGWIADRLLGAQRSIVVGGILIAIGHFILAIPSNQAFFLGLYFVILGTGMLKPNISAVVGQLYPEGGARKDAGYTIFYMGINLGAFLGPLVCAYLGENYGWHYGFGAAGIGMVAGLIQFQFMRPKLGGIGLAPAKPSAASLAGQFDPNWFFVIFGVGLVSLIVLVGLLGIIRFDPIMLSHGTTYVLMGVAALYLGGIFAFGGLSVQEMKRMVLYIMLLIACALFWAGFEQHGSTFNLFARDHTERITALGEIPAGAFQSVNSFFIITLSPFMAMFWVWLATRKLNPTVPSKFGIGLVGVGSGFAIMWLASLEIQSGAKAGMSWLIATYFVQTLGELCLSPVGLSAVSKLAPARFLGQMMGLWFFATALGNLIASLLAQVLVEDVKGMPGTYTLFASIFVGVGILFLLLSKPIQMWTGKVE
jgi:proton-dependent oligopeptide transporter, POT family